MEKEKLRLPPAKCVVGKFYEVPCVKSIHYDDYLPILGELHEDTDIFKGATSHWHFDHRFTSPIMYNEVLGLGIYGHCLSQFRGISRVVWCVEDYTHKDKSVNIAKNEIHYKRLKCKRQHPHLEVEEECPNKFKEIKEFDTLRTAFCGKELIEKEGEYFCPHRGTKVDVTNINDKGEIICPAHLLKFDKTFKAII